MQQLGPVGVAAAVVVVVVAVEELASRSKII